jgi:hypothetical protein
MGKIEETTFLYTRLYRFRVFCLKVIDEIPPDTAARPPLSHRFFTPEVMLRTTIPPPRPACLSTRENDQKLRTYGSLQPTPPPPNHNAMWLTSPPLNRMAGVKPSAPQIGSTAPFSKKNNPQVTPVHFP